VIEHWCAVGTNSRILADCWPLPLRVRDGSPKGRDPQGARSERSGDDSPVTAAGRQTPLPARLFPEIPMLFTLFQTRELMTYPGWRSHGAD
jgi:hypothetical protein